MSHDEQQEQHIRELAYRIWESEGRPEGQAIRHWHEACELVGATGGDSGDTLDTASGGVESGVAPPMPERRAAG